MHNLVILGCTMFFLIVTAQGQERSISGVEVDRNVQEQFGESLDLHAVTSSEIPPKLTTPDPSIESVALYRYILDMFGKKTFSGQMWVPWGVDELVYLEEITGKQPAIAGFDYINESDNNGENVKAIDYWKGGGIVTFMWHWGAPGVGEGYENSKATIDIDKCFIRDTREYLDFWNDLERIGNYLEELKEADVPVLWRPFHELDGGWFWWSKEGPEQFKRLWIAMYDYLVNERGLNHLIWVLCYTGNPDEAWFPGADYVDIAGADIYDLGTDSHQEMYNDVLASVKGTNYPIAFHETGMPPIPEACVTDKAMWSWWMIWHTDYLTDIDETYLSDVFNSPWVITLDEVPDIVTTYGWDESCDQSVITPSVSIDGADFEEGNMISVDAGSKVVFKVDAEPQGVWSWSGYATLDNGALEQKVNIVRSGTATATLVNSCGAVTTQDFHVLNVLPDEESTEAVLSIHPNENRFLIYPSPVSDKLTVKVMFQHNQRGVDLTIVDMNGRHVFQESFRGTKLNVEVSHLIPGVYTVFVAGDSYMTSQKIIKK